MAPIRGDLWPIRSGESSAKKTTDESNVATTVQKRFSASWAKSKGEPSLVRNTTTSTRENKQDVPNNTPICWNKVTNPTNINVRRRRMRLGLMVASSLVARLWRRGAALLGAALVARAGGSQMRGSAARGACSPANSARCEVQPIS